MDVMIVEDFLDSQTCEELRSEASVYCPKEIGINIHGGRNFIPFSSFYFNVLLQRSVAWKTLNNRLQSQEFLDWLVAELAPDGCDHDLRATTCYGKRRSKLTNCIQEESRIRTTSNFLSFRGGKITKVTFSILIRLSAYLMEVRRHLIYRYNRLRGATAVELLYDYSRASDGYFREIHRDSDERRYVFLLYLNQLDEMAEGGDLQMFKLKEPTESFPARPSEEECVLVRSCPPKEGCMVVFRNTFDSYHAVGQMSGHSQDRDFLYGGVTQLGGINPNMQHARDDMPTEFGLYT